jgi:hypothetical protein
MARLIGTLEGLVETGRTIIGTSYIWLGYRYEILELFILYINTRLMVATPYMVRCWYKRQYLIFYVFQSLYQIVLFYVFIVKKDLLFIF